MLEPDPQTGALYCLAQQVQLHNGHSTHSTCICMISYFFLLLVCFTWSGGCVCVCVMQEPTTLLRIIDGATISGVELVGTGSGPPPPPPPVPTPFVVLCYRYVPAIRSELEAAEVQKLREGWRPPSMTANALQSLSCHLYVA